MKVNSPKIAWTSADGLDYKPSWKREEVFVNEEHASIWEKTKDLPGWQDPQDSQKLYEMAFYSGQVILEIGVFGGRSAVVELCGAIAAKRDEPPQYYGLDVDPGFFHRSLQSVQQWGVDGHCLYYHGNLQQFLRDLPIVPTMVFLDGDHEYPGVINDLRILQNMLAPGTPVLCHDYHAIEGVRRAVNEVLRTPYFKMLGQFSGSILLQTTNVCSGKVRGLSQEMFQATRQALVENYTKALSDPSIVGMHTPVETITENARLQLAYQTAESAGRTGWPYSNHGIGCSLPATLPNGKPWPRISVITASYNQGKYIEQTILSVANQNYPNIEHIVIDGGSTDETLGILDKYRNLFAYCVSEKDRGQSHAINKGFAQATGDIVTWLNSDDMLTRGALASVAMAFHTSGADMVAGICQLHRDGTVFEQHLTGCADGALPLNDLLDLDNGWNAGQFFYQPEVFYKRALWLRAGGTLDESLYVNLDYELWIRFAKANAKLKVIGRPLALFRVHDEQKTHDVASFQEEQRNVRDRFIADNPNAGDKPVSKATARKRSLRITMFNDLGFRYGAGIAHERVANALKLAGHTVLPLAVSFDTLSESERELPVGAEVLARLEETSPDVVIIGNVHSCGLDPIYLKKIAERFSTVFFLHDKWLITGRCAYSGECQKNLTGCDESCPTAYEYPALKPEEINSAWQKKRDLLLQPLKLVLAANSAWMQRQIDAVADAWSAPDEASCRHSLKIRFGVPLDIFRPQNQTLCRELLGLPQDKFILLFSASSLEDRRKGISHLVEAIKKLNIPDIVPVCIGRKEKESQLDMSGLITVGYLNDPHRQAMLYSAADLFVAPSLEEAFGQVFIEAAACGTPSVAYPIGGAVEAVVDGMTGRLADQVSPAALAKVIGELYSQPQLRRSMGSWGRVYVENEFSPSASYHSISFPLRHALEKAGVDLQPKISLLPELEAAKTEPVRYILQDLKNDSVKLAMERYCEIKLRNLRAGAIPYPLNPQAWLVRWFLHLNSEPVDKLSHRQRCLESAMLKHYEKQLREIRSRRGLWQINPNAWLVRLNRNTLRNSLGPKGGLNDADSIGKADLEAAMERYYEKQLRDLRDNSLLPWYLNPKGWLARINRHISRD